MEDRSSKEKNPLTPATSPEPRFAQLRVLWSFIRPHRYKLLLGLALALLGSALELANPMVIKLVLDTVEVSGSLTIPITLLLCLFVSGTIFGLWHWIVLGTVAEKVVLEARTSLVRRYFRASLIPLSRRPSGELVTRATSDTVLLREAASSSIISLVNGAVLLVGTLVMMGILDLVLLGVTVTAIVIVTILFLTLMPAIAKAQERVQHSLGLMGGVLDSALRAIRTVKVSRAEERLGHQILTHAEDSARYGVRSVRREAIAWTISFSGTQLAIITILGVGAMRVAAGEIGVSTLVAFLLYAFTLLTPVVPGAIRENLLFSNPEATDVETRRVLEQVRLSDKSDTLTDGLDTALDSTSFSGGQRQRIALARALLRAPEVLLLDEATSQVDAITEAAITESVRAHAARGAVVTIAHRLSTVIHADRIILMTEGRVRAQGTHDELLEHDELYGAMVAALHIAETEQGKYCAGGSEASSSREREPHEPRVTPLT